MDSRNISLLTHQNTMQIHCGYVLRDGGGKALQMLDKIFPSPCININSRVSQQFSSCHSSAHGAVMWGCLSSGWHQSCLQCSHRLSKPFGIINPHGPGCPELRDIPSRLPVISWYVK